MRGVFHVACVATGVLSCWGLFGVRLASSEERAAVGAGESQTSKSTEVQDLVRSALEAGAKGQAQRQAELAAEALELNPDFAPALWASGQVRIFGKWLGIDRVPAEAAANPALAEYRKIRGTAVTARDHIGLAKWCSLHVLKDEAQVHLRKALELDANNAEAIKLLGLKLHGGVWMTEADICQQQKQESERIESLKKWQPIVTAIVKRRASEATASQAAAELAAISDPAAVPALEAALANATSKLATDLVKVIGGIRGQDATEALVRQAVLGRSEPGRTAAADALKSCERFAYMPLLLSGLTAPAKVNVELDAANNQVKVRQVVKREGQGSDQERIDQAQIDLRVANKHQSFFVEDAIAKVMYGAEQTKKKLDKSNHDGEVINQRIIAVLKRATGEDFGPSPRLWWDWWMDHNGYYESGHRPMSVARYDYDYELPYDPPTSLTREYFGGSQPPKTGSCFAKGTPVWTMTGLVPIEDVQAGDRVLSQDAETGELAYKSVVATTLRRDQPMSAVSIGAESITATHGHVFWASGQGWQMAKELAPGQRLQTASGSLAISDIAPAAKGNAYNLVVADFGTYFVGQKQLLVHDNTLRKPTSAVVPGLVKAGGP